MTKDQIAKGDLRWTFLGEEIDLDRMVNDKNVPAVWLRYCIDPTDWQIVDAETGNLAGPATGLPDPPEAASLRSSLVRRRRWRPHRGLADR